MKIIKKNSPLIVAFIILLAACSPPVYNIGTYVNKSKIGSHYKKIYILGMLNSFVNNSIIENDFAEAGTKYGVATLKNTDVFPSTYKKDTAIKTDVLPKAISLGCDAIMTIALKDIKTESRYVPGTTEYVPTTNYNYYNQFPTYYNNYYNNVGSNGYYNSGYYNAGYQQTTTYQAVETEGHYEEDKVYFLECNMFDANTQVLLFSIQSKTYNPTDVTKISEAYTKEVIKTLQKEGVIKPVEKKK